MTLLVNFNFIFQIYLIFILGIVEEIVKLLKN